MIAIDKETIRNRVVEIERNRSLLEDFVGISYEDFVDSRNRLGYDATLHRLQVAIQAAIDIAKHICAVKGQTTPGELKGYFTVLTRLKIIDKELSEKLIGATGIRNIIMHSYVNVDSRRIYDAIQNDLPDLDKFVLAIEDFLKTEEDVKIG